MDTDTRTTAKAKVDRRNAIIGLVIGLIFVALGAAVMGDDSGLGFWILAAGLVLSVFGFLGYRKSELGN